MISTKELPWASVTWYLGTRIVYTGDAADPTFLRLGYCYELESARLLAIEPAWLGDRELGCSLAMTAVWQTFITDALRKSRRVAAASEAFARGVRDALGDEVATFPFSGAPPGAFHTLMHRLSRQAELPIRPYRGKLLVPAHLGAGPLTT